MASSLKETAFFAIRERLLSGTLPAGGKLSELAISRELGISRTPVREAINQLASEGLVEHRPNAGAFVKKPSRADLEDVYEVREWLETTAVVAATKRITSEKLNELQEICTESRRLAHEVRDSGLRYADESTLQRRAMAESMFHITLMRASGNRRAVKILGDNHIISQIWGHIPDRDDVRMLARIYREHSRILKHIRRGDAELARRCMLEHIRRGRDSVLAAFDWHQRQLSMGGKTAETWPEPLIRKVRQVEQGED
ncbi:MAG: GntR family transcriptional regulator [Pirellulales bacterium]|nr:GntR family transcriptional regulator [Pirellulales bacterium]